ncbi:MAG: hypothetical protein ACYDBH_06505 [Acidobacteriaceae bacterium]
MSTQTNRADDHTPPAMVLFRTPVTDTQGTIWARLFPADGGRVSWHHPGSVALPLRTLEDIAVAKRVAQRYPERAQFEADLRVKAFFEEIQRGSTTHQACQVANRMTIQPALAQIGRPKSKPRFTL